MDQKDVSDELQLSLSESFNSMHVSEELPGKDNGKIHHILQNVEEWENRKDAKEKAKAMEKIQQFKIKYVSWLLRLKGIARKGQGTTVIRLLYQLWAA